MTTPLPSPNAYEVFSQAVIARGDSAEECLAQLIAYAEDEGLLAFTANLIITVAFAVEDFEGTLVVTD